MGWSEPEKCCCCCELRTGCLVIGYLGAISYGILALFTIIGLASGPVVIEVDGKPVEVTSTIIVIILILEIFFGLIYICLLVGVYTKRSNLVRIAYTAIFGLTILYTIVNLCEPSVQNAAGIIGTLLGAAFEGYLILCMRAFALSLQDERAVSQGVV